MSRNYYGYRPYVPVAARRAKAAAKLKKMTAQGLKLQPVELTGRKIARTFWGKAWCQNLESYMDYENRLPRGRSYVCNGSVLHLEIKPGQIEAKVAGSDLYSVNIQIAPVAPAKWKTLCRECAGQIGSLLELLSGKLSDQVMAIMSRKESGLFPAPKEIKLNCSCPDWATMCKHVAAVLYGVGARLDTQPELLFLLRSVDQNELVTAAVETDVTGGNETQPPAATVADTDLAAVFGIEIDTPPPKPKRPKPAAVQKKKKKNKKKASSNKSSSQKGSSQKGSSKKGQSDPL